jgi:hypothetical protein
MIKPVIVRPFASLRGDDWEFANERAGIREFDGGQSREYAEMQAAGELAYAKAGVPLPADFDAQLLGAVHCDEGSHAP